MRRVALLFLLGACSGSSAAPVASAPSVAAAVASSAPVAAASASAPIATPAATSPAPAVCQEAVERRAREPRRGEMCAGGDDEFCLKVGLDRIASGDLAGAAAPLEKACEASMAEACRERALLDAPVAGGEAGRLALLDRACQLEDGAGCHVAAVRRWIKGDTAGARRDLARGCEQVFTPSCSLLGWMNDAGEGGRRDVPGARRLFERSSRGVDLGGCERLASHVASGFRSGMSMCDRLSRGCPAGCDEDCQRQAAWLRRSLLDPLDAACRAGRTLACVVSVTARGEGVHVESVGRLSPEDLAGTRVALVKLCEGGMALACGSAANHLRAGSDPPDLVRVADLVERGCKGGDSDSCVQLGKAFEKGEGRTRDARRALTHYERACSLGSLLTCRDLAEMYREGDGVKADAARAAAFARAAETL